MQDMSLCSCAIKSGSVRLSPAVQDERLLNMNIVTLCENRLEPCIGLRAVHGSSLYIEYDDVNILYDVGPDNTFAANAKVLGVDLESCAHVVISHGHVDHAGGIACLSESNSRNILIHPKAFQERLRMVDDRPVDIGISKIIKDISPRHSITYGYELAPGVWVLINDMERQFTGFEKGLYVRSQQDCLIEDLFEDELSLAFRTEKGLVIAAGCSHGGVANIIREGKKVTGIDKVYAFIGGLHLTYASEEEIHRQIGELAEMDIPLYIVGHCTGLDAFCEMKNQLSRSSTIICNHVGFRYSI